MLKTLLLTICLSFNLSAFSFDGDSNIEASSVQLSKKVELEIDEATKVLGLYRGLVGETTKANALAKSLENNFNSLMDLDSDLTLTPSAVSGIQKSVNGTRFETQISIVNNLAADYERLRLAQDLTIIDGQRIASIGHALDSLTERNEKRDEITLTELELIIDIVQAEFKLD